MIDRMAARIEEANRKVRIPGGVLETPLDLAGQFSEETGLELMLKGEHLQRTGSFKMRGAMNKALSLTDAQKKDGVVTASSGNHGMASAQAARVAGTKATIYLPENVSPVKLANVKRLGATPILVPGNSVDAERAAATAAAEQGLTYISPYSDEDIIAGQGTIGAELQRQCPDLDAVFICVGGGGLISGIGSWMKTHMPNTDIVGCWPEQAAAMHLCLEKGEIYDAEEGDTLSDGSAGGVEEGSITFPYCQQVIDRRVLVTEQEIASAVRRTAETERFMIEGAAGVALAAALKTAPIYSGKKIAVVLCGRNIALSTFQAICAGEYDHA